VCGGWWGGGVLEVNFLAQGSGRREKLSAPAESGTSAANHCPGKGGGEKEGKKRGAASRLRRTKGPETQVF